VDWIAVGLVGSSSAVSVATLVLVWLNLGSTRRVEQGGEKRLEILREQRDRLQVLREERRMLEEELKWRRSIMEREGGLLELDAPPEYNGLSEPDQPTLRSWWRRVIESAWKVST
jgi:hypothetical protein